MSDHAPTNADVQQAWHRIQELHSNPDNHDALRYATWGAALVTGKILTYRLMVTHQPDKAEAFWQEPNIPGEEVTREEVDEDVGEVAVRHYFAALQRENPELRQELEESLSILEQIRGRVATIRAQDEVQGTVEIQSITRTDEGSIVGFSRIPSERCEVIWREVTIVDSSIRHSVTDYLHRREQPAGRYPWLVLKESGPSPVDGVELTDDQMYLIARRDEAGLHLLDWENVISIDLH